MKCVKCGFKLSHGGEESHSDTEEKEKSKHIVERFVLSGNIDGMETKKSDITH